jgi:hypothetical protein
MKILHCVSSSFRRRAAPFLSVTRHTAILSQYHAVRLNKVWGQLRVSSWIGLQIQLKRIEHQWQWFSWIYEYLWKENPAAFPWHSNYRTILSVPVWVWIAGVLENLMTVNIWQELQCIWTIHLYFREFRNWIFWWWWEACSTSVVSQLKRQGSKCWK